MPAMAGRLQEMKREPAAGVGGAARKLLKGGAPPPTGELYTRYLADLGYSIRDGAMLDQAAELASSQGHSSLLATIELKRTELDGHGSRSEVFIANALGLARAQK